VEADVWLFEGNEELLVGHSSTSLSEKRTLRSLYVDPLVELLDSM
jgi:rRNA biogenesis protein RRP5